MCVRMTSHDVKSHNATRVLCTEANDVVLINADEQRAESTWQLGWVGYIHTPIP